MPLASFQVAAASQWESNLSNLASALAQELKIESPFVGQVTPAATQVAKALLGGDKKAVLLGNAVAHHANGASLLALANWIAQTTGATVGYLTEAANTVGAQMVGAQPQAQGLNALEMLQGGLKAAVLLNVEPEHDTLLSGPTALDGLAKADMVVTLSPFKTNLAISDVLLPIAPFTETSGTFVNAEGRAQSFHAVVMALAETRPAW
jgi:NADH-quinone oxidoreductase subunit G